MLSGRYFLKYFPYFPELTEKSVIGLSQIQLAKELEVSNVTINRWERQGLRPSFLAEERFKMFCDKNNIKFEE